MEAASGPASPRHKAPKLKRRRIDSDPDKKQPDAAVVVGSLAEAWADATEALQVTLLACRAPAGIAVVS